MKIIAACLTALVIVSGASAAAGAFDGLTKVVASYLEIQALLAADKMDGIKAPAAAISSDAASMGEAGAGIVAGAKAVEEAADLKTARAAFARLSEAVIAAASARGWKDLGDVKLAYCPMVNGSWLQREQQIRNPYYGASMLTCGEFKDPKK